MLDVMDVASILHAAQASLETVHPAAPWAFLTLAVWLSVYVVRRYLPDAWAALEKFGPVQAPASTVFQALPSVMAGALAGVALTGGDYREAWKGAAAGALAPLVHHVLKALPVPYRGAKGGE